MLEGDMRAHVQLSDGGVYAYNTIPVLAARIAIEPVGVAGPLGAIGGGVKVHESLSCQREWLISTAPRHRRRLLRCPQPEPRTACRTAYVDLPARSHTKPMPQRRELPASSPLLRGSDDQWGGAWVPGVRPCVSQTRTRAARRGSKRRQQTTQQTTGKNSGSRKASGLLAPTDRELCEILSSLLPFPALFSFVSRALVLSIDQSINLFPSPVRRRVVLCCVVV